MKTILVALFAVFLSLATLGNADAQVQSQTTLPAVADQVYPLVLAGGALAGIAGYALYATGMWTLPLPGAVGQMAIAAPNFAGPNRLYAIASAVAGAWFGDWVYGG